MDKRIKVDENLTRILSFIADVAVVVIVSTMSGTLFSSVPSTMSTTISFLTGLSSVHISRAFVAISAIVVGIAGVDGVIGIDRVAVVGIAAVVVDSARAVVTSVVTNKIFVAVGRSI